MDHAGERRSARHGAWRPGRGARSPRPWCGRSARVAGGCGLRAFGAAGVAGAHADFGEHGGEHERERAGERLVLDAGDAVFQAVELEQDVRREHLDVRLGVAPGGAGAAQASLVGMLGDAVGGGTRRLTQSAPGPFALILRELDREWVHVDAEGGATEQARSTSTVPLPQKGSEHALPRLRQAFDQATRRQRVEARR